MRRIRTESAPQYLILDRDGVYGKAFTRRIRAMGIRDRPTAPRWPWQNGHAERLIGSIRRECLDLAIVFAQRCVTCCALTRSTTTALEHISRWRRIRRYQDRSRRSEAFCRSRSSADYTISMFGSDFRHAQQCHTHHAITSLANHPTTRDGVHLV
jgi:hypothetical protein